MATSRQQELFHRRSMKDQESRQASYSVQTPPSPVPRHVPRRVPDTSSRESIAVEYLPSREFTAVEYSRSRDSNYSERLTSRDSITAKRLTTKTSAATAKDDVIFEKSLKLEEDIAAELEDFVFFARLGITEHAKQLIDKVLWRHLHFFPVMAEIAGFLLEYEEWKRLRDLLKELDRRQIVFDDHDERNLVSKLRILGVKGDKRLSLRDFGINSNKILEADNVNYECPAELQNIEILALILSKDIQFSAEVLVKFTESHFAGLIKHNLWWEATRIFTILCTSSKKGSLVDYLLKSYKELATSLSDSPSIDSRSMDQAPVEDVEKMSCSLVAKSNFMNFLVNLLEDGRHVPAHLGIWLLHAEVDQILQLLSRGQALTASQGYYGKLRRTCQIRLERLSKIGVLKASPSYIGQRDMPSTDLSARGWQFRKADIERLTVRSSSNDTNPVPRHVPDSRPAALGTAVQREPSFKEGFGVSPELPSRRGETPPRNSNQSLAPSPLTSNVVDSSPSPTAAQSNHNQGTLGVRPITLRAGRDSSYKNIRSTRKASDQNRAFQVRTMDKNDPHDDDEEDDEDHDEFPFTVVTDSTYRTLIRITQFRERVDYIADNDALWQRDSGKSKQLLEECIRFKRMGKSEAVTYCLQSLVLLHMTGTQKRSSLENGLFFRRMRERGSQELEDFLESFRKFKDAVTAQAESAGPLQVPTPLRGVSSTNVSQLTTSLQRQKLTRVPTEVFATTDNTDTAVVDELGNSRRFEELAKKVQWTAPDVFDDKSTRDSLNKQYKIRDSNFFSTGKIFSILWQEPLQGLPKDRIRNIIRGPHGEAFCVNPHQMVVIRNRPGTCWCVAINTYQGRGLGNPGFRAADINAHTTIYDSRMGPRPLPEEPKSSKRAIAVEMASSNLSLDPTSRVHLENIYAVDYNAKVQDIGQVVKEDLQVLITYVNDEVDREYLS